MGNKLFQGFDEAVRGLAVGQMTVLEVRVVLCLYARCVTAVTCTRTRSYLTWAPS